MTPNSIISFPPSGGSPLQSGDSHSFRHSYFTNESAMETFQGLQGTEFEQPLIRRPTVDYSRTKSNILDLSALYQQPPSVEWHQMQTMAYECAKLENSCQLSLRNDGRFQSDLFIKESDGDFACGCTWPQSYESGVLMPATTEPGCALGCFGNSLQQKCASVFNDFDGLDDVLPDSPTDLEKLSLTHGPAMGNPKGSDTLSDFKCTPALVDASPSKASDDDEGDSGDGNRSTAEGRISGAPYAKLIYKALMEAPNHSMVLQDIYQWFIDNTEKGSSVSTGWRNSIRHNLSMNAAFRKTSRKCNGDDSKRTSEWVLEPFAILEGVTPTTRYRKNGKKAYRSKDPGQSRVRSSRSRGISSRKSKFQSQPSPDLHQGMSNDQHQYTQVQRCTPPVMDQPQHSPYTPDCQQFLPGNLYSSGSSFSHGWEQFADFKSVQVDDGGYVDDFDHYGDSYPCVWTNARYY